MSMITRSIRASEDVFDKFVEVSKNYDNQSDCLADLMRIWNFETNFHFLTNAYCISHNKTVDYDSNYFAIPKALYENKKFKNLSASAKILFSIMLDNAIFSDENRLIDGRDRVYIYMEDETICDMLCCYKNDVKKILEDLEELELIFQNKQIKQRYGKPDIPNRIYVCNFEEYLLNECESI